MTETIVCAECDARADPKAAGWHAHLLDVEDDSEDELVFLLPQTVETASLARASRTVSSRPDR